MKVWKDFEQFWMMSYDFWKLWSNYGWPELLWIVYMKLLGWSKWCLICGHNVLYHHTIMCFIKHVMLKRVSGRCFTKWNPKFEFLHDFFKKNQTKLVAGHGCKLGLRGRETWSTIIMSHIKMEIGFIKSKLKNTQMQHIYCVPW